MMLYVDLDNTLIDSVKRLELEIEAAQRYGINERQYWQAVELSFTKYGVSTFDHQQLFTLCRTIKPDLSYILLEEWNRTLSMPHIFPDAYDFLTQFMRDELILLTTGGVGFQRAKIVVHDLEKYFKEIHIVPSPKAHHISPPNSSIFIDDSPREIDAMKTRFPHVHCILVRDPAAWEKQKISAHADVRCQDLLTAADYIKNGR